MVVLSTNTLNNLTTKANDRLDFFLQRDSGAHCSVAFEENAIIVTVYGSGIGCILGQWQYDASTNSLLVY